MLGIVLIEVLIGIGFIFLFNSQADASVISDTTDTTSDNPTGAGVDSQSPLSIPVSLPTIDLTPVFGVNLINLLPTDVDTLITQWANAYGLNVNIIRAQCWQESRGKQNVTSSVGAIGLMQLMPATAAGLGVDPNNPSDNVRGGCIYMRKMLDMFGTYTLALAAYNAGPGNVQKYGGIPPFKETQAYVSIILGKAGYQVGAI